MTWTTSFCSSSLHFCHLSDQLGKPSQLMRWTHSKPTGLPWLSVRQRTAKSVIATCRLLGTILLLEFFWTPPPRLEARSFMLTSPLKVNHLGSTGHFRKQNSKRPNLITVCFAAAAEKGVRGSRNFEISLQRCELEPAKVRYFVISFTWNITVSKVFSMVNTFVHLLISQRTEGTSTYSSRSLTTHQVIWLLPWSPQKIQNHWGIKVVSPRVMMLGDLGCSSGVWIDIAFFQNFQTLISITGNQTRVNSGELS